MYVSSFFVVSSNRLAFQFGELILFFARCMSELLFVLLRYVFRYRRSLIRENLRKAFPAKSEADLRRVTDAYYYHICDLCVEPVLFYIAPAFLRERLTTFDKTEVLDRLYSLKRNVVLLASHYGNWEYLVNLPSQTRYRVSCGYSPVKNRLVDRLLLRMRSRFGISMIPKRQFYRRALDLLRQTDEPNMVVVIGDQRPGPDSRKHHLLFLDMETDVQIGAERMAMHTNAAVVLIESEKIARFQYRYTLCLMNSNAGDSTPLAITANYFHRLENSIRYSPVYWLWSHNRWKEQNVPILSR